MRDLKPPQESINPLWLVQKYLFQHYIIDRTAFNLKLVTESHSLTEVYALNKVYIHFKKQFM